MVKDEHDVNLLTNKKVCVDERYVSWVSCTEFEMMIFPYKHGITEFDAHRVINNYGNTNVTGRIGSKYVIFRVNNPLPNKKPLKIFKIKLIKSLD